MWRYLFLIAFFVHSGSLAKLKNDKTKGWREQPRTKGLLYPFESESRNIRSLDGMWRFLKAETNDSDRGLNEKWFTGDLDKVHTYKCVQWVNQVHTSIAFHLRKSNDYNGGNEQWVWICVNNYYPHIMLYVCML